MRIFLVVLILSFLPASVYAIEAPAGQTVIDSNKVLRGEFIQETQMSGTKAPLQSFGRFVVAPAYGLLWNIEHPFPTTTIITPTGAAQNLGGLIMKLPTNNHIRHICEMVRRALAGDWNGLENDYIITQNGTPEHWQMHMTPRQTGSKPALPYADITVTGSNYVEDIMLMRANSSYDRFSFKNENLSPMPLLPQEAAAFKNVAP